MNVAALLTKLGSWPVFVEAVGKLDDTLKSISPQGARIGSVRGREAAADKAALSAARKEANAALATLHRDAQSAGVTSDLASFKSEVAAAAKPVLQDEGAHMDTLAFFDTQAGRGRPKAALTQKALRDKSVAPERQHADRVGRIAPPMSKAEVPEDIRVKDVYGELTPDQTLGSERVRGSQHLGDRAGGAAERVAADEATPIPDDMRAQASGPEDVNIDELIFQLQSKGKYLGPERFRGGKLPAETRPQGNTMGTSGEYGAVQRGGGRRPELDEAPPSPGREPPPEFYDDIGAEMPIAMEANPKLGIEEVRRTPRYRETIPGMEEMMLGDQLRQAPAGARGPRTLQVDDASLIRRPQGDLQGQTTLDDLSRDYPSRDELYGQQDTLDALLASLLTK